MKRSETAWLGQTARVCRRAAPAVATTAVLGGTATALASLGAATYFARRVITPERDKKDDTRVVSVDLAANEVTLQAAPHTISAGHYGLWTEGGSGHSRLGEVLATDLSPRRTYERTVRRELQAVDEGALEPGPARWNSYYYHGDPRSVHGLVYDEVHVTSDVGELPAWRVPPGHSQDRPGHWAVLVHGRSAQQEETLRALPVLHELGYTTLVPKYRNDVGAPPSVDGRYNLGLSEWRDVEAAIRYAIGHGATSVTLLGWSMGGAIVLQTLARSDLSAWVDKVVLDCPVIDWGVVLSHHADLNRIPRSVALITEFLMGRRATRRLVGVATPIDIAITDWVQRAEELTHPMLIMHTTTDDVVPYGPSAELAARRPDLVRFEVWEGPLHCRLWNADAARWESDIRDFLTSTEEAPGDRATVAPVTGADVPPDHGSG